MATIYGTSTSVNTIPASGLVLHLDAGNRSSYPGTGTTWTDLSGSSNNCILSGTATTWTGSAITFDGTANVGKVASLNLATTNYTIIAVARYSGLTRGRVVTAISNNWLLGHWSGTTENYYAQEWVTAVGAGSNDTNWRVLVGTGDIAGDVYNLWVNNQKPIPQNPSGGIAGPNGIAIACHTGTLNNEPSNCQVGVVLAYNRVLTDKEIGVISNIYINRYINGI
jgi:hypothetical protein